MAVQIESPGQVQEFLDILKRRKWQILLPTLLVVSLGIAFAVVVPKKYEVTTQIELRELFLDVEGEGVRQARERVAGIAENATEQIRSMRRITQVIEDLKWSDYLTLDSQQQAEYRNRIRENIKVSVPRKSRDAGSSFITIEYLDVSRERAQQFLKEVRQAWLEQVVERDRSRIDEEYRNLLEQKAELDKQWQKEQRLLSDLRVKNGISPTQPTPGVHAARTEDPMVSRHEDHLAELEEVELELATELATLEITGEQLLETEPTIPRTEVTGGVSNLAKIQQLEEQRATLEAKLIGKRKAHSAWATTQKQLELIDAQIRDLRDAQTEGEINEDFEPNPRYGELEAEIEVLERSVAKLSSHREALNQVIAEDKVNLRRLADAYREDSERSKRIDILVESLSAVELRLQAKKQLREVINGPTGNPFQITQEVEVPNAPTEPDPVLILLFSVILGLAIGMGSALAAEFSKSCFRSAADISRVMVVPVLGVIAPIVTRAQVRRTRLVRLTVGMASFLLIGSILFVTWAWSYQPDLLADGMMDSIEEFRTLFL